MGIVLPLPLTENLILQRFDKPPFSSRGLLDLNEITKQTRDLMRRFKVKASDGRYRIRNLWRAISRSSSSGGSWTAGSISC